MDMRWPTPTMVKEVRGFLGFGNFYRQFIRHYLNIAKPLNDTTKKDQPFKWTAQCQQAFDELKKRFTEELVLIMPDQTKPFQIKCNASKYASGAVLTQIDGNSNRHPCAFISKKLKGIMKYRIENYWPLYKHLKNDNTTFKDRLILPWCYLIIKT